MEPIKTLYICSLGIREPLVQTQVLPYLRELAAGGVGVHILTFEPALRQWRRADRQSYFEQQLDTGIRWHALPYQRRPALAGAIYDVFAGAWFAARLAKCAGIRVFHARAHIP